MVGAVGVKGCGHLLRWVTISAFIPEVFLNRSRRLRQLSFEFPISIAKTAKRCTKSSWSSRAITAALLLQIVNQSPVSRCRSVSLCFVSLTFSRGLIRLHADDRIGNTCAISLKPIKVVSDQVLSARMTAKLNTPNTGPSPTDNELITLDLVSKARNSPGRGLLPWQVGIFEITTVSPFKTFCSVHGKKALGSIGSGGCRLSEG